MATITWHSSGSGLWSVGTNWNTLFAPGAGDTAVLGANAQPYTVTIDTATSVADIVLTGADATLSLLGTLTLSGAITVARGAAVSLAGTLRGGTLDLTAGGALTAAGGTLDAVTTLGQFASIDGTALTNDGTIDWSTTADGVITIATDAFTNLGQIDLAPVSQLESGIFTVGVQVANGRAVPIVGTLEWEQAFAATTTISAAQFTNSGDISIAGGALTFNGSSFSNRASLTLADTPTQTVAATATVDGIAVYNTIETTLTTQVTFGAGLTSFDNSGGTITADRIVFATHQAFDALGHLNGALTFQDGLDLQGHTLAASNVNISGTVQDGVLNVATLTLAAGTTLDSVAISPAAVVQATGPITLLDPPASVTSVALNAVTTELLFSTVTQFNGSVVAGSASATDVIGVLAPGGVTFGSDFALTARAGTTVDVSGKALLQNDGTMTADAALLEVFATLAGSGTVLLANGGAARLHDVVAGAKPAFSFGTGTARLVLPGTGALGGVLTGLHVGDTIDFAAISSHPKAGFGKGAAAAQQGTLFVNGASGDQATVAVADVATGVTFMVVPDGSGGTSVEVACFVAGTRIATPHGAVAVEALQPGDHVLTASGRAAPVRWVGSTRVDLARHPAPQRAAPIRIQAGAFGDGLPRRDLLVSPEHCLLVDGVLIPASRLANGATVARQDGWASVSYWHIELDRHDVLLAEGLPAESYLDTGNRGLFAGEAGLRPLHPAFDSAPSAEALAVWAERGCAPLCLEGPALAAARARLLQLADASGWATSRDPGLAVVVDGVALPRKPTAHGLAVRLPAGTRRVLLRSRSFVPAEIDLGSGDTRRLGVAVAQARLGGWPLHPDAFAAGWHVASREPWRWSDGAGVLTMPKLARPTPLELRFGAAGSYWLAPQVAEAPRLRLAREA